MKPTFFRLIAGEDVAALLAMDELIEAMEDALRKFSSGGVVQPVRTVISVGDHEFFGLMPALVRKPPALGAKLVTVFGNNAALDLPTHLGVIVLLSPHTGALVAVMDGRSITAARTAAVSAVSATSLARQNGSVLAIIGSGVQARSHLEAMEIAFKLSEVRVWSPTPDHQSAFLSDMESTTTAKLVGTNSAEQAVRSADIVVLATSAAEPVVRSDWIKNGTHVIGVGACRPNQREMDPVLVGRGRLFVDSQAAALVEAGDIVMGIREGHFAASHIAGELGNVLAGTLKGRQSAAEVTIFKSVGMAVEDVVAANLVYQRALDEDAGTELEL